MKSLACLVLPAVLAAALTAAGESPASASSGAPLLAPTDAASYLQALRECAVALQAVKSPADARALDARLPDEWHVIPAPLPGAGTNPLPIDIPLDWLHLGLRAQGHSNAPIAPEIQEDLILRLRAMTADDEIETAGVAIQPAARPVLDRILQQREYRGVEGPSDLDNLYSRVRYRIGRFFSSLFEGIARHPAAATTIWIVFLCLAAVGLVLLGMKLFRSPREVRKLRLQARDPWQQSWSDWLRQARAALARGEWEAALHGAYGAAATFLAAEGVWRLDPSRTPREYLALLAADGRRAPWRKLIGYCEAVWYQGGTASSTTAQGGLACFEALQSLSQPQAAKEVGAA